MKNLTTKIENEIARLETIRETAMANGFKYHITGRITSLKWVLQEMTDIDEEESNVIGGVDFSDSLGMLDELGV